MALEEKHATEGKTRTQARSALTGQISSAWRQPHLREQGRCVPFTLRGLQTDSEDVFKIQAKGQVFEPLPSQFSSLAFRGKARQP